MLELFLNAARKKYRYTYNGQIMTEDLFDLDSAQLDQIYRGLMKGVKKASEDSLLEASNVADKELIEKAEIVKYVFQYKQDMAKRAEKAAETRRRNRKILELIQKKEDGDLEAKSLNELRDMLNDSNASDET